MLISSLFSFRVVISVIVKQVLNYVTFRWVGGFAFRQNVLFGGNKEFVYLNKMQA